MRTTAWDYKTIFQKTEVEITEREKKRERINCLIPADLHLILTELVQFYLASHNDESRQEWYILRTHYIYSLLTD